MLETLNDYFSEQSPLLERIPQFSVRAPQKQLSIAIANTINSNTQLIAEAATGTGKTFAYLIPAILSQKKVVISTGTRNLQDQLFQRDLPLLQKAMGVPLTIALLKGRSNYLCRYRIEKHAVDGLFHSKKMLHAKKMLHDYQTIQSLVNKTDRGDIAECNTIPEDASIWPAVTSNVHNCLGQECSHYKNCFLVKARKQAMDADIIVINHHLFFADERIKEEGFGELLPLADTIIFDEAHHLPEIASRFFGDYISSRQLFELIKSTEVERLAIASDMRELSEALNQLEKSVADLRISMQALLSRGAWSDLDDRQDIHEQCNDIAEHLQRVSQQLEVAAQRSKGLENCWQRSQELLLNFRKLTQKNAPNNVIHWYEVSKHAFSLHFTPMTIADNFNKIAQQKVMSWIFTSATLSVDGQFSHFQEALGLLDAKTLLVDSPFDYQQQAILYLPRGMPDPRNEQYIAQLIKNAVPIINACQGRSFLLFTSHRALQEAHQLLAKAIDFPILTQGSAPKHQLLEQFRQDGHAVLLGTSSFWQGVDVKGEALSCVIIDKLPFESPKDPIIQARTRALQKQGIDAFSQYQLPRSIIALKQGVGRLIRDAADHGVLMLCDPRLTGREYGKLFFNSLPSMQRTRELSKVLAFIESWKCEVISH